MGIKEVFRKLFLKEKYNSNTYIDFLRKKGIEIGNDCTIYAPNKTFIDIQYPWMIKIGNNVRITEGCKILTHDYAWSVLKGLPYSNGGGAVLGASGIVEIGNNVFIGMNTIITRNVRIGDNVVVGAGSVVTKDCESNFVYAGNPARRIMSVEEFYKKRKEAQLKEAKELAIRYFKRFGNKPPKEIFHEYFMLFTDKESIRECAIFNEKISLCGNTDVSVMWLNNNSPVFKNFDEFLSYCLDE